MGRTGETPQILLAKRRKLDTNAPIGILRGGKRAFKLRASVLNGSVNFEGLVAILGWECRGRLTEWCYMRGSTRKRELMRR